MKSLILKNIIKPFDFEIQSQSYMTHPFNICNEKIKMFVEFSLILKIRSTFKIFFKLLEILLLLLPL